MNPQIQPLPECSFPNGCDEEVRHRHMLENAWTRFDLVDGMCVQPNACPKQEGVVVAIAYIHVLRFDVSKQAGILSQVSGLPPTEWFLPLFKRPNVGGSGGEYGKCGLSVNQAAGNLTHRSIAANGENGVVFFLRGLMGSLNGVSAAQCFSDIHIPTSILQRLDDPSHETADGKSPGSWVIE
jgi:hypothetical protein